MNKQLGGIGLCRKAGKLCYGFDSVKGEIVNPSKKIKGVLLASDASAKTQKEVNYYASKHNVTVQLLSVTMDEIAEILNKKVGVLGVMDDGLFKLFTANIDEAKTLF